MGLFVSLFDKAESPCGEGRTNKAEGRVRVKLGEP